MRSDGRSPSSRDARPDPPPERSYWDLLPRRNLRRALFLVLALIGVLVIKRAGGFSFGGLFDAGQSARPAPGTGTVSAGGHDGFQHLEVKR
jgi:hypothetical protein